MERNHSKKLIRNAIKTGDIHAVKKLIGDDIEVLNTLTVFGTWLHVAVKKENLQIVRYLVEKGIDVNAQGGTFSANALERAAAKGHIDIAKYLINHNIKIDISEPDKNPLFAAIYNDHFEMVKLLVENHINISITYSGENMKEMDAYTFALERGQIEIAEYLKRN
ncbi:ankyrin repeat domain-containing protein [Priestia aryabhattai]|uniref:ankyrin repeat domain-containing protein n=1 Tax=Priestia aryabhattai TaxID=412384 RepID=UPI003CF2C9A2